MKRLFLSVAVLLFVSVCAQGQQVTPTRFDERCFNRLVDTLLYIHNLQKQGALNQNSENLNIYKEKVSNQNTLSDTQKQRILGLTKRDSIMVVDFINSTYQDRLDQYFEKLKPLIRYYGFDLQKAIDAKYTCRGGECLICEKEGQIPYKLLVIEIMAE